MPLATGDHTARVRAALAWLESLCGDYAPLRRQFIAAYFRFAATVIDAHRTELSARVQEYDGARCRVAGCRSATAGCRRILYFGTAPGRSPSNLLRATRTGRRCCSRRMSPHCASGRPGSTGSMRFCRSAFNNSGTAKRYPRARSAALFHRLRSLRGAERRSNLGDCCPRLLPSLREVRNDSSDVTRRPANRCPSRRAAGSSTASFRHHPGYRRPRRRSGRRYTPASDRSDAVPLT
jgi:hypothetical protein